MYRHGYIPVKITESQLRRIIREEMSHLSEQAPLMVPLAVEAWMITSFVGALNQLKMYNSYKNDADIRGLDKYFHFLAFCWAAQYLLSKRIPAIIVESFLIAMAEGKELTDWLARQATHLIPKGIPLIGRHGGKGGGAASREWARDRATNIAGINAGLSGDDCCRPALQYALSGGAATVWRVRSTWHSGVAGFESDYGWALNDWPHLYDPNDIFIQPRYHCSLSPAERRQAWDRRGFGTPGRNGPAWGLRGPLSVK